MSLQAQCAGAHKPAESHRGAGKIEASRAEGKQAANALGEKKAHPVKERKAHLWGFGAEDP
jgi:hypothetical protein